MYILQDAAKPNRLPFPVIVPIKTVYSLLEDKDSLHLITDKRAVELVTYLSLQHRKLKFNCLV